MEIFPLYSRGNSGFFQECVYLYYHLYSIQGQEEILKIVRFENVTALSLFKLPVGLFREHDWFICGFTVRLSVMKCEWVFYTNQPVEPADLCVCVREFCELVLTPYSIARSVCSSMSTLAMATRPSCLAMAFSSLGPRILQGPHQLHTQNVDHYICDLPKKHHFLEQPNYSAFFFPSHRAQVSVYVEFPEVRASGWMSGDHTPLAWPEAKATPIWLGMKHPEHTPFARPHPFFLNTRGLSHMIFFTHKSYLSHAQDPQAAHDFQGARPPLPPWCKIHPPIPLFLDTRHTPFVTPGKPRDDKPSARPEALQPRLFSSTWGTKTTSLPWGPWD